MHIRNTFVCILLVSTIVSITAFIQQDDAPQDIVALGRMLFFDPILSEDYSISCSSCHIERAAFADTVAVSVGVHGRKGKRNTPSAMNVALQDSFFWDGRAATLEEQALMPIENPDEMNLSIHEAVERLNKSSRYRAYFRRLFGELPNRTNLAKAIAAFERSLETTDTPFDDWRMNGNEEAVSIAAKRGFDLFNNKGKCIQCHFGADFTTGEFRNIGLFNGKSLLDSGRAEVTKNPADLGKFKVGSLRNSALTAPYMHNGMFKTLEEVIEYYDDPLKIVPDAINIDTLMLKPLALSDQDKTDLVAFLHALTDRRYTLATPSVTQK